MVKTKKTHKVVFYSPGTLVAESTTKDISEWCPKEAMILCAGIKERHGATPYGFQFETYESPEMEVEDWEFQPKRVATSGMYFIMAQVKTADQTEAEGNPENNILVSNMRHNGWDRVAITTTSYKWTQPFKEEDRVVDVDGNIVTNYL